MAVTAVAIKVTPAALGEAGNKQVGRERGSAAQVPAPCFVSINLGGDPGPGP